MARGPSGRIVVELDPDLKASLYAALAQDRMTLRDWLVRKAADYTAQAGHASRAETDARPPRGAENKTPGA